MTIRTWVYDQLRLTSLPHDAHTRVFPKRSMRSAVEDHPFIVYKLGNESDMGLSETSTAAQQYFQIYVHDFSDVETGDYMKIDDVVAAIKARLTTASSSGDGIIEVKYLETSQDLNDETLSTVFKYIRFVAVRS